MVKIGYKKCVSYTEKYKNERCVVGVFEINDDAILFPSFENSFRKYKVNKCKLIRIEINGTIIDDLNSIWATIFFSKEPVHEYKLNEEFDITTVLDHQFNIQEYGILMFFEKERAESYLLEMKENGLLIQWRDDGSIYCEENYLNNRKHGICKYYHSNGILKEEVQFGYGYNNGLQKIYNIKGELIKEYDFTRKININFYDKT